MKGRINVKKRLLAMMMAIVMVMTLLPTSALAAGGDTGLQEGQVRATKALVLDNENKPAVDADGYYTVQIPCKVSLSRQRMDQMQT